MPAITAHQLYSRIVRETSAIGVTHLSRHIGHQKGCIDVGELPSIEDEHDIAVCCANILKVVRAGHGCKARIPGAQNALLIVICDIEDASLHRKLTTCLPTPQLPTL